LEMVKVLFVCTGNICRSPTAEGIFAAMVKERGLSELVGVDSAGIERYHVGEYPDRRSVKAAKTRGYDLDELVARQVSSEDFKNFDLILAMDTGHLDSLKRKCPPDDLRKIHLFLNFSEKAANKSVPDPYYGDWTGFMRVLEMIEDGCKGLLNHIQGNLLP